MEPVIDRLGGRAAVCATYDRPERPLHAVERLWTRLEILWQTSLAFWRSSSRSRAAFWYRHDRCWRTLANRPPITVVGTKPSRIGKTLSHTVRPFGSEEDPKGRCRPRVV